MRSMLAVVAFLAGCGARNSPPATDSAAVAKHADDSIVAARTTQAPAFADTARSTMAVLLNHPGTAFFDSLIVVQPPKANGVWPAPYVCGRIGGKPGVGGRNAMTPFIYGNRLTVFVLDAHNAEAFAALRAKDCNSPGARVLFK